MKIKDVLQNCDNENYIESLKECGEKEVLAHVVKELRSMKRGDLAYLLKQDEKEISIYDLDNERVNLEKGIWIFASNTLKAVRERMIKFLSETPANINSKLYGLNPKTKEKIDNILQKLIDDGKCRI